MKKFLIDSVGLIDGAAWVLVAAFFCGSAALFEGDVSTAFIASGGIILVMALIGLSIEVMIESIKDMKGIGTITGFITNGPEAVVLIVGLVAGDILFAASTPLGSNVVNPLLLGLAAVLSGLFIKTIKTNWKYSLLCILVTIALAVGFYQVPSEYYLLWVGVSMILTLTLFFTRPSDGGDEDEAISGAFPRWAIIPASVVLISAGYFLDPVVEFASQASKAPKGMIGFLVLSTLTSWPEFKSCISLFKRGMVEAAGVNIFVSNITNIWLAVAGVVTYLLLK